MDAIKFIKEYNRMCDTCVTCKTCPCWELKVKYASEGSCWEAAGDYPELYIPLVEKWSAEHPPKTRLDDLLEKYPDCVCNNFGVPKICCSMLGYEQICESVYSASSEECAKCWNQPLEDE